MIPEIVIKPRSKFSFGFKELWQYHNCCIFFHMERYKVRYKQVALGVLWTVIQPLFLMFVFVYFFLGDTFIKGDSQTIPKPIFIFPTLVLEFFS